MMKIGEKRLIEVSHKRKAVVQIFDMTKRMEEGKKALEEACLKRKQTEHVICVVMGGDGSIARNIDYLI